MDTNIPTANTVFCFESKITYSHFCERFPELSAQAVPFEDFVEPLFKNLSEKNYPNAVTDKTLELLIGANILKPQEIELAFSLIPESPRNKKLKREYIAFLRTENAWNAYRKASFIVEQLQKNTFSPSNQKIVFFKARLGAYLFREFADAIQKSGIFESTEILFTWNWQTTNSFYFKNISEYCNFSKESNLSIYSEAEPFENHFIELNLKKTPTPAAHFFGDGLVYLGNEFEKSQIETTLFENTELETLRDNAFQVPSLSQEKEEKEDFLKSLQVTEATKPVTETAVVSDTWKDAPFKSSSFSASQLEKYHSCPARYYFSRLRLEPPLLSSVEGFAMVNGKATHRALELYFRSNTRFSLDEDSEHILELYKEALDEISEEIKNNKPLLQSYLSTFERYLPAILVNEAVLLQVFGPRKPFALEKSFEFEVAGKKVRGFIDRIDETADGKLLLLDYKTGEIDFTPKHLQSGDSFQAWLYIEAAQKLFQKPVLGFLFYDLKKGELKRGVLFEELLPQVEYKKLFTRGHTLTLSQWDPIQNAALNIFVDYTSKIEDREFTPIPKVNECRRCEASPICRRSLQYE